jgi:hypothetical protein
VGQPLVVSADPEVNRFIFQQEGKLFRSWYPEAANIIIGEKTIDGFHGAPHKFIRNSIYKLFGLEYLKHNLLPELEAAIRNNFAEWATKYAIDIHDSTPDVSVKHDPSVSITISLRIIRRKGNQTRPTN